jgi:hypothetical protein
MRYNKKPQNKIVVHTECQISVKSTILGIIYTDALVDAQDIPSHHPELIYYDILYIYSVIYLCLMKRILSWRHMSVRLLWSHVVLGEALEQSSGDEFCFQCQWRFKLIRFVTSQGLSLNVDKVWKETLSSHMP